MTLFFIFTLFLFFHNFSFFWLQISLFFYFINIFLIVLAWSHSLILLSDHATHKGIFSFFNILISVIVHFLQHFISHFCFFKHVFEIEFRCVHHFSIFHFRVIEHLCLTKIHVKISYSCSQ